MDNTFYNQNNFYNPGFIGGATYPTQQPPKAKMVNPLTQEERAALKVDNSFTLMVTPDEMAKGICTHKDTEKGAFAIVPTQMQDGTSGCTCQICHTSFNPDIVNEQYAEEATTMILNVLETCKLLAVDMNGEVIREFFQMIPFLKKVPQLYRLCNNSFNRYSSVNGTQQFGNQPNYFNAYNMLMNPSVPLQPQYGGFGTMGFGAQPQQYPYGAAPMTPTMQQQQMAVPGGNPFYQQPPVQPTPTQQIQQPMQPPVYSPAPATNTATTNSTGTGEAVVKETIQL